MSNSAPRAVLAKPNPEWVDWALARYSRELAAGSYQVHFDPARVVRRLVLTLNLDHGMVEELKQTS